MIAAHRLGPWCTIELAFIGSLTGTDSGEGTRFYAQGAQRHAPRTRRRDGMGNTTEMAGGEALDSTWVRRTETRLRELEMG